MLGTCAIMTGTFMTLLGVYNVTGESFLRMSQSRIDLNRNFEGKKLKKDLALVKF